MDLALVQFHNLCYGSMAKACAKYFQDSTRFFDALKVSVRDGNAILIKYIPK